MHFFPKFYPLSEYFPFAPSFTSMIFGRNQEVKQNLYLLKITILNMYSGIIKRRLPGIPLISIAIILYFKVESSKNWLLVHRNQCQFTGKIGVFSIHSL